MKSWLPWLLLHVAACLANDEPPLLLQTKAALKRNPPASSRTVIGAPTCWNHSLSCWDCSPEKEGVTKELFYLHITKSAGCSAVADLSRMVGREKIFSYETCYPWAAQWDFPTKLVMLRRPRDQMLSLYEFCRVGGVAHHIAAIITMPSSFQEWIMKWHSKPTFGDFLFDPHFNCICPYNLQTTRLVCNDFYAQYCHEKPELDLALEHLNAFSAVGIKEAYQESMCLFEVQLLGFLPEYCDCEDANAWASAQFTEIHEMQGSNYTKYVDDYGEEVLGMLDEMTAADRVLYRHGVERLMADLDHLHQRFGTRVLCPERRNELLRAAGIEGGEA